MPLAPVLLLVALACRERAPQEASDAVPQWTAASSIPQVDELLATLSTARVVGLGDDPDLGLQSLELRLEISRWLIESGNFSAVATTASFAEALEVDAYVRGDPGTARETLSAAIPDEPVAEPLVEFVEWMREHNQHLSRPAGFWGLDSGSPAASIVPALRFLERVDPEAAAGRRRDLEAAGLIADGQPGSPESDPRSRADAVRALLNLLSERREEYSAAGSAGEWDLALRHAVVAQQAIPGVWFDELASGNAGMAQNLLWLLDREGPEGRIVVWAGNDELARSAPEDSMGEYLAAALGEDLYVAAITSEEEQAASSSRPESAELTLRRIGEESYWLDLRRAPGDRESSGGEGGALSARFDGLFFVASRD
jgi:erythromycin esterase